jgi:RpiR family carbohydrate utilization transcriptional regulator
MTASPGTPLLERLGLQAPTLRNSEQKVAALVREDPHMVMNSTMAAVAEAAGVSEPTVMRFAVSFGYDGFQSFKIDLAQALALGIPITYSAITADDPLPTLTTKIFDHTISSLDRARRSLDAEAVGAAVEALCSASSVLFVGFGASSIIAQDAEQKFALFGVPCSAPIDPHQQFMAASMSGPGSVMVAISNTGRTDTVIQVAAQAKSRGVTVIGMTGANTPLLEYCDIGLIVKTFEDTDLFTPTVSRLAGLVVVDILATAVAMRRGPDHLEKLRAMKADLTSFRTNKRKTRKPGHD